MVFLRVLAGSCTPVELNRRGGIIAATLVFLCVIER